MVSERPGRSNDDGGVHARGSRADDPPEARRPESERLRESRSELVHALALDEPLHLRSRLRVGIDSDPLPCLLEKGGGRFLHYMPRDMHSASDVS